MAVSHAEAPFSLACFIALCPAPDSLDFNNSASLDVYLRFLVWSADFTCLGSCCKGLADELHEGSGYFMRGVVTSMQALNWLLAFLVEICTPRPPWRDGRANNSHSRSVIPCLPSLVADFGCFL